MRRRADWRTHIPVELEREQDAALFEAATKVAFYFWDWRHKILTYFLAFSAGLAAAAEWLAVHHAHSKVPAIPLFIGFAASSMLAVMDLRNGQLLHMAHNQAAEVERKWNVTGGFYTRIAEAQTPRNSRSPKSTEYRWYHRWTTYNVTMSVWLGGAAASFLAGAIYVIVTRW